MSTPAIQGPVPPYSNVNINAQYYAPQVFIITAVNLGFTTTITTSVNHDYVIGQEVRLNIPPTFGCRQLNQLTGFVLSIPSANQVVTTINSSQNVDPFVSSTAATQPQIVAIGDVNKGVTNISGRSNTGTYIPGSFINIS
jgi:hypothetical protein